VPLSEKDFTRQKKEEIRKKFDQIYEKLYGRTYPDSAVEFINFKVRASLPERLFKFSKLARKANPSRRRSKASGRPIQGLQRISFLTPCTTGTSFSRTRSSRALRSSKRRSPP